MALEALGRDTVIVFPACETSANDSPYTSPPFSVPVYQTCGEDALISAAALRAGLRTNGRGNITVIVWVGVGSRNKIGFAQLAAALERNDDIILVSCENEASLETKLGCWNLAGISSANRIPFVATATISQPDDLKAKFRSAKAIKGFRLINIFSPCPV